MLVTLKYSVIREMFLNNVALSQGSVGSLKEIIVPTAFSITKSGKRFVVPIYIRDKFYLLSNVLLYAIARPPFILQNLLAQ